MLLFAIVTVVIGSTFISKGHPRVQVARDVATWRWGNVCNGHVVVQKGHLKPPYIAWASWSKDDAGTFTDCRITFSNRRHWQWWDLCRAMVHEYGHLSGWMAPFGREFVWYDKRGRLHRDPMHSRVRNSLMWPWTRVPYRPCGPDHNHPRHTRSALHYGLRKRSRSHNAAGSR